MNKKTKVGFMVFLALIAGLLTYNIICTKDFFNVNIGSFITVLVAVFVTFYLTQSKNDDRNTKELVSGIVEQIQSFAIEVRNMNFEELPDNRKILLQLRCIRSKTEILCKYATRYKFQSESGDIRGFIAQYTELLDNHQLDLSYLQKSVLEISRWMENIDSRCDQIRIKLYPPS